MHPFPHLYTANADAPTTGEVTLTAVGLPTLASAAPAEFDGPGDQWSPESLLVAAVADCFVLSFRAVAAASKFSFTRVTASCTGTLERPATGTQFTRFEVHAALVVPAGTDLARAQKMLEKAEQVCLVTNSLKGESHLHCEISTG